MYKKIESWIAMGVGAWKVTIKKIQGLDLWREEESLSGVLPCAF
jgi:hypothetical protein